MFLSKQFLTISQESDPTLFEYQDPGTYVIDLRAPFDGRLLFVGNGGSSGSCQAKSVWVSSSGGSGACFEGMVHIPAGSYILTIGALGYGWNTNGDSTMNSNQVGSESSSFKDSNGNNLITVGCGGTGSCGVSARIRLNPLTHGHTIEYYGVTNYGAGGTLQLGTLNVTSVIKQVNGNAGSGNNAVSAYDGTTTGYGAGNCGVYGAGTVYAVKGIFLLSTV